MNRFLALITLIISVLPSYGQKAANTPVLSNRAEISIITIGPWQHELYSAFGHSAIRVYDPVTNADGFFNYGVFNFNQPNFYLNFARGYLNYKLDVDRYIPWREYYISNNRFVHEQVLNLDSAQTQKVFDFLYWNSLPENQYYFYDYFYNNCATKLRDVVVTTLGDKVQFDTTYIKTTYTIRQLTDIYLENQPWGDLGIDICLGLPMDKTARPLEYMFLPDYVEASFDHATIQTDSGRMPLVRNKMSVYDPLPEEIPFSPFHPWIVFGAFLGITVLITYLNLRKGTRSLWFDLTVFGVIGLVGTLLLFLWLATDHHAAARNMNILWAMPLHLIFLPLYWKKKSISYSYFKGITALNVLVLLLWAWLPQQLNVFLIPVVLALTVRSAYIGWKSPK